MKKKQSKIKELLKQLIEYSEEAEKAIRKDLKKEDKLPN